MWAIAPDSWDIYRGSGNDHSYSAAAYHSPHLRAGHHPLRRRCQPGADSCRRKVVSRSSWISFREGVTGIKGYSDEPLVQAVAAPGILFERYTRGWSLAEEASMPPRPW